MTATVKAADTNAEAQKGLKDAEEVVKSLQVQKTGRGPLGDEEDEEEKASQPIDLAEANARLDRAQEVADRAKADYHQTSTDLQKQNVEVFHELENIERTFDELRHRYSRVEVPL